MNEDDGSTTSAQSGAFVRCLASFGSKRWLKPGAGSHAAAFLASDQANGCSPPGGATRAETAERHRSDRGVQRRSDIANYDTRTHAHAHTRTHARTHTHTHTHTCVHVKSIIIVRIGWFCLHRCSQCYYRFTMSIESHASLPYVL